MFYNDIRLKGAARDNVTMAISFVMEVGLYSSCSFIFSTGISTGCAPSVSELRSRSPRRAM